MNRRGFLLGILAPLVCAPVIISDASAQAIPIVRDPLSGPQNDLSQGGVPIDWTQGPVEDRLRRGARRADRRVRRGERRTARVVRRTARRAARARLRSSF
jgi:hypothetical protein